MSATKTTNPIEIVFSFDTTGSMYPCLAQVRANLKQLVRRLFADIPDLRIGIIAHGDYCDKEDTYVTSLLGLTSDPDVICNFVQGVKPTGGGDAPECYELVLHEARTLMGWTAAARRALVMIGDATPHDPGYGDRWGYPRIDWRQELAHLSSAGIGVYGVQCLGHRGAAEAFWRSLGSHSGGFYVTLDQFSYVTDLIMAICYQQQGGAERVSAYEAEISTQGRMSRGLDRMFAGMLGKAHVPKKDFSASADLRACPPSRFQVLEIGPVDCGIKDVVQRFGLLFKTGRGFYEFTKTETIQGYKEVVLMDRATGDLYEGKVAREIAGLPEGVTARLKPKALEKYIVFVQSTSPNRKLLGGTKFLYEVDSSR